MKKRLFRFTSKRNKAKKHLFHFALKRNEKIGSKTKFFGSETKQKYALLISLRSEAKNLKRKKRNFFYFFSHERAKRISFRFEAKNIFLRNRRTLGMAGLMTNGMRRLTGGRRFELKKKQKKRTIRDGGKAAPTWPVLVIRRHPQQMEQNSLTMQRV